jgi:aspartyl-tRNA(Asn)/glutamyl-tRNA(Gln) amidotransferase subunit A
VDLTRLSLSEASRLLARGEISAVELASAYLRRIEALDPLLNCFISVTNEIALDQAGQADQALKEGRWLGPLHGIPVTLKDLFETQGVRTTAGSKILSGYVPAADCAVYRELRLAGAVLLGKTNMHEWAYGVTNQNPHFGSVRNPWNLERISGGSSGGSAAALAAGCCLGSLGTDTGGSIRIPASLCGTAGLKPTFAQVSREGVIPLSRSLDHVGPMARCVEDLAVLYGVIVNHGRTDLGMEIRRIGDSASQRFADFSVALASDEYFHQADPEVVDAVRAAASAFESLGARVEEVPFPGAFEARDANITLLLAEAAAYHAAEVESRPQDFGADVLERLVRGAGIPAERITGAWEAQTALREQFLRFFDAFEVLLTPATPEVASPIGEANPLKAAPELTRFTAPFNLTGLPALSIPCGFTRDGLPIGLQLVGPPGSEWKLLQAAYAYEQQAGWFLRRPEL